MPQEKKAEKKFEPIRICQVLHELEQREKDPAAKATLHRLREHLLRTWLDPKFLPFLLSNDELCRELSAVCCRAAAEVFAFDEGFRKKREKPKGK